MTYHSFPSTPLGVASFSSVALLVATRIIQPVRGTRLLHDALLEDILPPMSSLCSAGAPSGPVSTNFIHSPPDEESDWSHLSEEFEDDVFRFQMDNGLNLETDPKSWRIRVGRGGNIYSLLGMFGEAVPPQHHENAPFIDEVYQSVAVNTDLNDPEVGEAYFIHQAGCYIRDNLTDPFFSRSLHPSSIVAEQCDGNQCSAAAWGQQAHIPTVHEGSALYFNRYADCGDGVMEHTTVIHNAAEQSSGNGTHLNYFNVPWSGIRTSTLRDLLMSTPGNAENATHVDPHPVWGDNVNGLKDLDQTGGYSIYAQNLPSQFDMPCGSATTLMETDCPGDGQVELVMGSSSPCSLSAAHTANWGRNVTRCYLGPNITEVQSGAHNTMFTIRGTDIIVEGVMHWSWAGRWFYFFTETATVADELNDVFDEDGLMELDLVDGSLPYEENLALAYVHGDGRKKDKLGMSISDLRFGTTGSLDRDATIFTVRAGMDLPPGYTYVKRQYLITDMLHEMDERARGWVNETFENIVGPADQTGRTVTLYKYRDSDETFGASVSDEENCSHEVAAYTCVGSTAPKIDHVPLFAIECGDSSYVGEDQYGLSPEYEEGYLRPYMCEGEDPSARPSYRLLGYFPEGGCMEFRNWRYDEEKCDLLAWPSEIPTSSPSFVPSGDPSYGPSDVPSSVPSSGPSAVSSGAPSRCYQLIANGDIADGTVTPWLRYVSPIEARTPGADGTGWALAATGAGRTSFGYGTYQQFDQDCLTVGEQWTVSASFKLVNDTSGDEVWCNVDNTILGHDDSCPWYRIFSRNIAAGTWHGSFRQFTWDAPWDATAYNRAIGTFTVAPENIEYDWVRLIIMGPRPGLTILMDDVTMQLASPSEIPTSSPSFVPSVMPSVVASVDPSSGPSEIPTSLPSFVPSVTTSVVPSVVLSVDPSSGPSEIPTSSPSFVPSGDPSSGPSSVLSSVPSGDPTFGPSSVPSSVPSTSPSFVSSGAPSRCYQLIANGDIANGAVAPWWPYPNSIEARTPGADGTGWALAATGAGRTSFGYGTHQQFDQDCLTEGEQWTVSASFKLVNDTSGDEVWCDVDNSVLGHDDSCPWYRIFSREMTSGSWHGSFRQFTWDAPWNATAYNRATGTFTVELENIEYDWVRLIVMGPRPGLTILMDDVTMTPAV